MAGFIFTPSAREDVLLIRRFLTFQSPSAADRVLLALQAACRRRARTPGIGHFRSDLTSDARHRFWRVYSYLIMYRPDTSPLEIVRVIHAARDIRGILETED